LSPIPFILIARRSYLKNACAAVARPVTPAYPTVTAAFSTAVLLALRGTDPHKALSAAARTIDENLLANHEYSRPLSSS